MKLRVDGDLVPRALGGGRGYAQGPGGGPDSFRVVVDAAHELLVPHPDGLSEQGLLVVPEEHEDDFVVHARGKDDVVPS